VRRTALALSLALGTVACSSGSPVIPANLRGPVAITSFIGYNPALPEAGLVPLVAIASFQGDELRLIDPATDSPVAAPSVAWPIGIPTAPRPSFLASASLNDGMADLLVVGTSGTKIQIVGTWLQGIEGYGVTETLDLSTWGGAGAQILALAIAQVPSGPPAGDPAAAPPTVGKAWVVVGFGIAGSPGDGRLVVLEASRKADGSIMIETAPVSKPLGFSPSGVAAAPDNVHLYLSSLDLIPDGLGGTVSGVAEVDASRGLDAAWPVRGFDARGCPTTFVAAAFVGERIKTNFYTFSGPTLRVYAALDLSGCGPERAIACGVATFDPVLGGLALDPALEGPPGWPVPIQGYRTPMYVPALPLAIGIAMPPAFPGEFPPSEVFGSQVCQAPTVAGTSLPPCPNVTEVAGQRPFNGNGALQDFMMLAPPIGQLWTSVTALVTASDGLAYVQDLGRFGVVAASAMVSDSTQRTQASNATLVGPAGPFPNSSLFGFPSGTAAVGFWLDQPRSGPVQVVSKTDTLGQAITVWPGFTTNDSWSVSFQGVLPGFFQRRSILGLHPDGTLYVAIQEAAVPSVDGMLPASFYWVTGAFVGQPDLGVHTVEKDGPQGDIPVFLLDEDPCPSTRPNWIPAGSTTPVYDPTKAPQAHETVALSLLEPDPLLYPGGAIRLGPADGAEMAAEYACLVAWFQQPGHADKVLTAFRTNPPSTDYARGAWVRAGGFLLAGSVAGYAGRPQMDVRYNLAWTTEEGLSGEALVLARKARRFYYPAGFPNARYDSFPDLVNPMVPGPVVGFRLGRFCPLVDTIPDCNDQTSPPARDAGVFFQTSTGLEGMTRYPPGSSGGISVTSFDKSTIPGQEYRGRVFYPTFVGNALMMIPPGLDVGQSITIR
jgi:hypothetical protein